MMLPRLYSLLLHLYPAEHRRAWGPGMQTTFELRARELGRAGPARRWRFACKELAAVVSTAFSERLPERSRPLRAGTPTEAPGLAARRVGRPGQSDRQRFHPPRSPRRDIVSNSLFELRVALRGWRREPLATAVILLTLTLGIGAGTAIFSVVDGVLLRPLPFPTAGRLVQVHETLPDGDTWTLSMPDFTDVRAQSTLLDAVTVYENASLTLTGAGDAARIDGMRVSAGFFEMLGTPLALGRSFAAADEGEDAPLTVILGNSFWRSHFAADAGVLGKTLRLDSREHTIIGVAPAGIDLGSGERDVWIPFPITAEGLENRGGHMYPVVGRLAENASLTAADAEVVAIMDRIATEYPNSHEGRGALLRPLQDEIVGDIDQPLLVLLGAVGMLLLIACANVASILLAQSDARGREVALRTALGANRGRLVGQLLAESTLMTFIGGACGIVLAHFGVAAILGTLASDLPRAAAVHTDWGVVAFGLAVSCVTGIGVGLLPALRAVRGDLHAPLKAAARSQAATGGFGLHRLLVVAETALAVMLVLGAGLLVQSLVKLQGVDKGFDPEGAVTFRIGMPESRYPEAAAKTAFVTRLRHELAQQPGVEAVGAIGLLPFFSSQTTGLHVAGEADPALEFVEFRQATPGVLEAIGTRVLRGRDFDDGDVAGAPPVIMLNETAATRLFGEQDPIGRYVQTPSGWHQPELEVVGVVEDVRMGGLRESPPPAMYWPFGQYDWRSTMSFVVRTPGDAAGLVPLLRNTVQRLDPELPIYSVELLTDRTLRSVSQDRLTTWLLSGFAALALLLAAIGVFGVMAYSVVRRRREIGVRVAIGAGPGDVVRGILKEGAALAVAGLLLGTAGGLALARTFSYLLYETSAADPATIAGVAGLLVAVAMLACLLPAWRAANIDPMVVLRND